MINFWERDLCRAASADFSMGSILAEMAAKISNRYEN
jgi:hypothetical protein